MENIIVMLLNNSIIMSLVIVFLFLFSRIFFKQYSAKWRYYTWIIVLIGLLIPFRPQFDNAPIKIDTPIRPQITTTQGQFNKLPITQAESQTELLSQEKDSITISWYIIVCIVWILGFITLGVYYLWKHRRFTKMVKRWSKDIDSGQIIALLINAKKNLNITNGIALKTCKLAPTPMLIGFLKPTILLPTNDFQYDELELILKHELIHFKRKDLWYKAFVLFTIAVHWFNPVVYLMARAILTDCEISCDEAVLKDMDLENRKFYGETIIGIVKNGAKMSTAFSTQFNGGMKNMKKRLFSIVNMSKKRISIAIVVCAFILTSTMLLGAGTSTANAGDHNKDNTTITSSNTNNVSIDISSIKKGGNVKLGDYQFRKGDTVQVEFEHKSENIDLLIFAGNQTKDLKSDGEKIEVGDIYKIPNDGNYYFSVQNKSVDRSESIKGTILFSCQTPQTEKNEKIQFTDDKFPSDDSNHVDTPKPSTTEANIPTPSTTETNIPTPSATGEIKASAKVENTDKNSTTSTLSNTDKVPIDISSIKKGEEIKLGDYQFKKGDTVQVEFEHKSENIDLLIIAGKQTKDSKSKGEKIVAGDTYTIPQDGSYYFSIQNKLISGNGSESFKGTIQLNYQTPQTVNNVRIQFTDNEISFGETNQVNIDAPSVYVGADKETDKSPNDAIFDDYDTVLNYYAQNSYKGDYNQSLNGYNASLKFSNFSGSKAIYEFNFLQVTNVGFEMIADNVEGEYVLAFISENDGVLRTAVTHHGLQISSPIDFPKGKNWVVLVGEQVTAECDFTLFLND